METNAFRMVLTPGQRDESARRHREVWPAQAPLVPLFHLA